LIDSGINKNITVLFLIFRSIFSKTFLSNFSKLLELLLVFGHLFFLLLEFFFHLGCWLFCCNKLFVKFLFFSIESLIVTVKRLDCFSQDWDFIIFLAKSFLHMRILRLQLSNDNLSVLQISVFLLEHCQLLPVGFKLHCSTIDLRWAKKHTIDVKLEGRTSGSNS
jgi:hypothetical protein